MNPDDLTGVKRVSSVVKSLTDDTTISRLYISGAPFSINMNTNDVPLLGVVTTMKIYVQFSY